MAHKKWLRFLWPLAAAVLSFGLYGFWFEPASLRSVEHIIRLDDTTKISASPLRIAVITDLHGGAPYIGESKIEEVVALANAAKPDLILLAGDYVITGVLAGRHMPIEVITAKLQALSAPLGVYAVLGNHDRWEDDPDRIVKALERAGIRVLDDRAIKLSHGGSIYLAGISDWTSGPHDIRAALAQVPPDARAICFTHSPDVFPTLPTTCALTVAGHTHGGQVLLPYFGRPVVPSRYGQRYAAGLVRENGKYLFVSTGIGTSIIPVRFGVPPEVSILEIE